MHSDSKHNDAAERLARTNALKGEATRLGFSLAGACPAVSPGGLAKFYEWLDNGYAGEMSYLGDRGGAYEHPRHVMEGARSLLMLAFNYRTVEPPPLAPGSGRVARYAWGADYHDVIHQRLGQLVDFLSRLVPAANARGVVDTAPLNEREFARLAGLGWIGKNTLLLNRNLGSWFFLAALLTDAVLEYDQPFDADHCGTCRACLDACPTDAFVDAYVLDATKCLSYTTIEHRSPVENRLRASHGDWIFGCDVCQEVCPWNSDTPVTDEPGFRPALDRYPVSLTAILTMDEASFRHRFRRTPLWRAKRRGMLRNAALVAGSRRESSLLEPLQATLNDDEPLVRGASAWAVGRIGGHQALAALTERLSRETDESVRAETEVAIRQATESRG